MRDTVRENKDKPGHAAGPGKGRAAALTRAVAVAVALALWGAWPAAAGASEAPVRGGVRLEAADPAPQAWVHDPPPSLRLRFSEPVALSGSEVRLSSYRRAHIPGRLSQPDPQELIFTPAETLEEATYEVMWTVRTPSGDTASGRYGFTYLRPTAEWQEPLDRREINRILGNLLPGWLLVIPAAAGLGGILWILWNALRS